MIPTIPEPPQAVRDHRAQDAAAVIARIPDTGGGRAAAVEADLSDPATPAMLFDAAEEQFGPVDILIYNAPGAGWPTPSRRRLAHRLGRSLQPVTAETWSWQFTVDAMGVALMISEFARRHIARQAISGPNRTASPPAANRVPRGGLRRSGQGRPGELHDVSGHRAGPVLGTTAYTVRTCPPPTPAWSSPTPSVSTSPASPRPIDVATTPSEVAEVIAYLASDAAAWSTAYWITPREKKPRPGSTSMQPQHLPPASGKGPARSTPAHAFDHLARDIQG